MDGAPGLAGGGADDGPASSGGEGAAGPRGVKAAACEGCAPRAAAQARRGEAASEATAGECGCEAAPTPAAAGSAFRDPAGCLMLIGSCCGPGLATTSAPQSRWSL